MHCSFLEGCCSLSSLLFLQNYGAVSNKISKMGEFTTKIVSRRPCKSQPANSLLQDEDLPDRRKAGESCDQGIGERWKRRACRGLSSCNILANLVPGQ
jgi:hypothetical protein